MLPKRSHDLRWPVASRTLKKHLEIILREAKKFCHFFLFSSFSSRQIKSPWCGCRRPAVKSKSTKFLKKARTLKISKIWKFRNEFHFTFFRKRIETKSLLKSRQVRVCNGGGTGYVTTRSVDAGRLPSKKARLLLEGLDARWRKTLPGPHTHSQNAGRIVAHM